MDKQELLENIEKFDLTDEQLQEIDAIISGENQDFLEKPKINNPEIIAQDPIERFVSVILDNPTIKTLVDNWTTSEEKIKKLDNENNNKFWNFLKHIDIVQKIYNLVFILVCSGSVLLLKFYDAIGKETSQTLLTLIIGIGISNAIATFFKSTKK